jgi:hypothetical protein
MVSSLQTVEDSTSSVPFSELRVSVSDAPEPEPEPDPTNATSSPDPCGSERHSVSGTIFFVTSLFVLSGWMGALTAFLAESNEQPCIYKLVFLMAGHSLDLVILIAVMFLRPCCGCCATNEDAFSWYYGKALCWGFVTLWWLWAAAEDTTGIRAGCTNPAVVGSLVFTLIPFFMFLLLVLVCSIFSACRPDD